MLKPLGLGVAAALATVALLVGLGAYAEKNVNADVAPLIAKSGTACTVTDSRFIGEASMNAGGEAKLYEVSCQEGLGYVLIAQDKGVQALDCLAAGAPGPDGKPGQLACKLPENANPAAGFTPIMSQAGRQCPVAKARSLGSTPTQNAYEVLCQGDADYVLMTPRDPSGPAAAATPCLAYAATNIKCSLGADADQTAWLTQQITASGKPCALKDKRFVGTGPDHSDYFEIACQDGKGFMLKTDAGGKFASAIDCVNAQGIAGGCTLTDTRQALTEQNSLYSDLAKKAGFDCDVTQYAAFDSNKPGVDIVELKCSNRPDGGIGIFPASGAPQVLDCLRAQTEGYQCSFTPIDPLYSKLTAQLRARGRNSCTVSGARPFGRTTTGSDLVEVACADGGPGYVIEYAPGQDQPSDLLNCAQAAKESAGGCQLPTNKSMH